MGSQRHRSFLCLFSNRIHEPSNTRKHCCTSFENCSCLALPSSVQSSLDPLWRNDPLASAIAFPPAQQNQIPTRPQQQQGSEVWTHSCQTTPWQAPRWPFKLANQNVQESRGSASNDWQSSCSPPSSTASSTDTNLECKHQLGSRVSTRVDKTI